MTDTDDADRRFAANLFRGRSGDEDRGVDGEQEQTGDVEDVPEKRWLASLFADTDKDPIIAGLVAGKTVGRTTATKPPEVESAK